MKSAPQRYPCHIYCSRKRKHMGGSITWPECTKIFRNNSMILTEQFTDHVVCLKDLALVARTVTVHGEGHILIAHVFLRKGEPSTDWNLSTNDTISTEESRGEDMHRTTLTVGHASLTTYCAPPFNQWPFVYSPKADLPRSSPITPLIVPPRRTANG